MQLLDEKLILNKISTLVDPSTKLSLDKYVSKIIIKDGIVIFSLEYKILNTKELSEKEKLRLECERIIRSIAGVKDVKIVITNHTLSKPNKKEAIPGVNKVILIASGKGGVGKSTIAAHLAFSLMRKGYKVGLADTDIYGPSIPRMFNILQKPEIQDNMLLPLSTQGIKLMSVGFLVDPKRAAVWRGPLVTKTLHQLLRMTNWKYDGEWVDYLIIDTPPGTGDVHLSLAENYKIDGVILISTPQEIALIDVVKGIDMFSRLDIPIFGIIENMSYFSDPISGNISYIFGKGGGKKLSEHYNIKLLAEIPIEIDVREKSDIGCFSEKLVENLMNIASF